MNGREANGIRPRANKRVRSPQANKRVRSPQPTAPPCPDAASEYGNAGCNPCDEDGDIHHREEGKNSCEPHEVGQQAWVNPFVHVTCHESTISDDEDHGTRTKRSAHSDCHACLAPAMVFPKKMNVAGKNGIPIPAIGASYALTQKSSPGSVAAPIALARADANKLSGAASARSGNHAARVFTHSSWPDILQPASFLIAPDSTVCDKNSKSSHRADEWTEARVGRTHGFSRAEIAPTAGPFFRICNAFVHGRIVIRPESAL